jgi:hypothetical protein
MDAEREESESYRAVSGPVSDDYRQGVYMTLFSQMDEASEILMGNEYSMIETEADELLNAAGFSLPNHVEADFGRLVREYLT